jgi:hypothetical protein
MVSTTGTASPLGAFCGTVTLTWFTPQQTIGYVIR